MKIIFMDGYILGEVKISGEIRRVVGETQLEVMQKAERLLRGE